MILSFNNETPFGWSECEKFAIIAEDLKNHHCCFHSNSEPHNVVNWRKGLTNLKTHMRTKHTKMVILRQKFEKSPRVCSWKLFGSDGALYLTIQITRKHQKMLKYARKCYKNARQYQKMLNNVRKCQNMLENIGKHQKNLENVRKCQNMSKNARKRQ